MKRLDTKIKCPVCGTKFYPRVYYTGTETRLQKTCSDKCRCISHQKFGTTADGKRIRGICNCGKPIVSHKSKTCWDCEYTKRKNLFYEKLKTSTIEKYVKRDTKYRANHRYQSIRNFAKNMMDWNNIKETCSICGYNRHVEVCHKKSIASFPKETTLDIVNSLENLIYMCPNHHWELDNNVVVV